MQAKPTILITGANGQLGQEIMRVAERSSNFQFIFTSRDELAIDDAGAVRMAFEKHRPVFVINAAAYTAVDKAETDSERAYKVNAEGVSILASHCKEFDARFIHISTDYVFDGSATRPYREDDMTNPQSVYGASKLEGERVAMEKNAETIIIRTSWVYSEYGKNFVKTMLRLMSDRADLGVVDDQFGSPTYAADLAQAILQIIVQGKWVAGVYHYCNEGVISWFDLATEIKTVVSNHCKLRALTTAEYPTPAKRPAYSALDTEKIRKTFGLSIQGWKKSLADCLARIETT